MPQLPERGRRPHRKLPGFINPLTAIAGGIAALMAGIFGASTITTTTVYSQPVTQRRK